MYLDGTSLQINITPPKAKSFALAQSQRYCDGEQSFKPVCLDSFQKRSCLKSRERLNLFRNAPRRIYEGRDIPSDQLILPGYVEGFSEHGVEILHGPGT